MLLPFLLALLLPSKNYGSLPESNRIFIVPHRFAYWPSTDIPFEIDRSLQKNSKFMTHLIEGTREIEQRTCIKLVHVDSLGKRQKYSAANVKSLIFKESKTECTTYLSSTPRQKTRIFLTHNCSQDYAFVVGNLVQALGFIPEHARSDRDQYIISNPRNFESNDSLWNIVFNSGLYSNVSNIGEQFYTPYDIYSVTHMPTYPMGDQHLGPLVYYKDRGDQATSLMDMVHGYHEIPTATSLSSFDVTKINLRYECGYKSSTRTCHDVDEAMCQQEGIGYVGENTFLALKALNKCGNDTFAWEQCPKTCGRCHPDRMPTLNIEEPPLCDTFPIDYLPKRNVSDQNDVLYQALACVCSDKDYAQTLSDERIKYFCDIYACKTYMKYLC